MEKKTYALGLDEIHIVYSQYKIKETIVGGLYHIEEIKFHIQALA